MLYEAMHYKVPTINSFNAVIIGYMMNYLIPRAGEVSRCAALSKSDNVPVEKSLGSVVTERIVDMFLLIIILGIIFLLQFDLIIDFIGKNTSQTASQSNTKFIFLLLAGGLAVITGIMVWLNWAKLMKTALFTRIFSLVQGFGDGLLSIRNVKNPLLFIILSILIWVGYILMMYVCLFSLSSTSNLSFSDCLTVFALGTIGVVLPAPGAGAGTYHFFVMQSLMLYGVGREDGIAYATMVHGVQMVVILILGAIASLLVVGKKNKNSVE